MELFLYLVLAHIIGDFFLQNNMFVMRKEIKCCVAPVFMDMHL